MFRLILACEGKGEKRHEWLAGRWQILHCFGEEAAEMPAIPQVPVVARDRDMPNHSRDFAIELKPRPGELTRVASMLARHHVTLKAGVAMAVGPRLLGRFVPSDVEGARRALDAANVPFEEREVVPVLIESRAGELAILSQRLTEGGVALRALYITSTAGNLVELAIVADNADKTRRALE